MAQAERRGCPEDGCDGVMEEMETSDGEICDSCGHAESDRYRGGALDLTMSSGPWANDGETVASSDEASADGTVTMQDWPSAVEADPEDVTDKQEEILRAAARFPKWGAHELADHVGLDSTSYVYNVLRRRWPERHDNLKSCKIPDEEIDEIRLAALNGESITSLSNRYGVARDTIRYRLKRRKNEDCCEVPPLEWHQPRQCFRVATDVDTDNYSAELPDGERVISPPDPSTGEGDTDDDDDVEEQLNQAESTIREAAADPVEDDATPGVDAGETPVLGDHERAEALLALTATEVRRLARGEVPPELADAVVDGLMRESGVMEATDD